MSESHHHDEPIGRLGPFDLISFLGEGAMGQVWRAVHREQQVPAAIKIITGKQAQRADFQRRFRHEVRAVAGLSHPGIVMVFDFGAVTAEAEAATLGELEAGSPFLAMELCPRGSLLELEKRLSFSHVRSILLSLLDALSHAHARGVIHRDLKPANILLGDDTDWTGVKLTDFGLAFVPERLETDDFSRKGACGTPIYMPPEQLLGKWRDIGPWCDLYSLGCVAYQLVCGEPPYNGNTIVEVAKKHLRRPIPALRPKIAVPDEFEAWIERLLQKDPRHRFRNAADAAWQLLLMNAPSESSPSNTGAARRDEDYLNFANRQSTLVLRSFDNLLRSDNERSRVLTSQAELQLAAAEVQEDRSDKEPPRESPKESLFAPTRAPLPSSWHHMIGRRPSVQLLGAGLGLYGLRHIPLVGREAERDVLWENLCKAVQQETPRAVMLRGPAGAGKSYLAEWLCERAQETGAAIPLEATHSPSPGGDEGLPRMLARYFRTAGLQRDELVDRLRTWFVGRGVHDTYFWDGLAEIIKPATDEDVADGQRRIRFGSRTQRYNLIAQVLELICQERAVIVWLDDLQWADDSLAFLRFMLDSGAFEHLPVLFVATIRDDALADESAAKNEVARFALDDKVAHVGVERLSHDAQAELIEKLLYLSPALARQVAERTQGNPLFAVQLIGDWVDRGVLEVGEHGFVLAAGEEAPMPDDIFEVWTSRLSEVLSEATEDEVRALELAAILGIEVDEAEWRACLALTDFAYPAEAVQTLLSRRLFEPTDTGVRFVHGMLRESLERRARDGDRLVEHNRVCARMLGERYPNESRLAERLGRHLLAARAYLDALDPLLTGARARGNAGELDATLVLLDMRLDAIDALHLPEACAPRVQNSALRAYTLSVLARYDEADKLARRALRTAQELGEPSLIARCYLRLAQCIANQRDGSKSAQAYLEQAHEIATGSTIDTRVLAQIKQILATSLIRSGRMEEGVALLERARELVTEIGDELLQVAIDSEMGSWHRRRGHFEEAELIFRDALAQCERVGLQMKVPLILGSLADVVRLGGDLDEADALYRRALDLAKVCRKDLVDGIRLNLALVCVQREQLEELRSIVNQIRPRFEQAGNEFLLLFMDAFSLSLLAGDNRWEVFGPSLELLLEKVADYGLTDADMAVALQKAGEIAARAERVVEARRALEAAAEQWENSGKEEKARALRREAERLASLCP